MYRQYDIFDASMHGLYDRVKDLIENENVDIHSESTKIGSEVIF